MNRLYLYQKQFFLLALSLWLAACSSSAAAEPKSTNVPPIFAENGCIACHSVEPDGSQDLGPSLAGLATRSTQTIADPTYTGEADTVEAYLRESILNPEIYVVSGFTPLMPKTYVASLDEQELTELVNYLLTLK
jgi:cytochrome c2